MSDTPQRETLICYMRSGHALHHTRVNLRIPAEPGPVVCLPWQADWLRADCNVVVVDPQEAAGAEATVGASEPEPLPPPPDAPKKRPRKRKAKE